MNQQTNNPPDCASPSKAADGGGTADPFFSGRRHYAELDGLRGLAIIGVILLHFGERIPPRQVAAAGFAGRLVTRIVAHGAWGVDLFFVLSGFLITDILLRSRGQKHYFRNFYARRTLRIFPLYYGALFGFLVLLPFVLGRVPAFLARASHLQLWLWTYTANIYSARHGYTMGNFGHFWTLAIEEQFYLFWPLLIILVGPRRLTGFCLVAIAVVSTSTLAIFWLSGGRAYFYIWAFTPLRSGTLLAGALLASLRLSGGLERFRTPLRITLITAAPVTTACYLAGHLWPGLVDALVVHVALAPFLVGAVLGCVLTMRQDSLPVRLLAWKPLRSIGKYSYGMYVFHYIYLPIQVSLLPCAEFQRIIGSGLLGMMLYFASAVGVAYAVAFASYHLYEKHFLKLKKFFPERAAGTPDSA